MPVIVETARPLPTVAAKVDAELARMDAEIDWLLALSPIRNEALWRAFEASGHRTIPPLSYIDLDLDLHAARERLLALPVEDIESPLLSGLLSEKQRELDRQIELIRLRGTDGFVNASIDLFGSIEPPLLALAEEILRNVQPCARLQADAGVDQVVAAVEDELARYREQSDDFGCEVIIDPDLSSMMMVSHGRFYVDANIRLPHARVQPLIQHEIGTHVVTRHNGRQQSLKQLEVGLAHYDALQEGLGVLSEYLTGFLPGERLRVLAARVVAAEMAIHGEDVPAIFDTLHNTHDLPTDDAFDVAVRARRGGGLTKDAVYLRGLRELLEYLHGGGVFEQLFIGKFALSHHVVISQLVDEGWVVEPDLLPRYCQMPGAVSRLAECRKIPIADLYHQEPVA